jgi:two-component system, OmpR family, phosphate regulon response regulator PhoB
MKKILIVDDQLEVRELVNVTLRIGDYKILQSKNGKEAIEMVFAEKPDLVIMDVMMPGEIDGIQATRIIKNKMETQNTKIIMLTAKGQEVDKKLGIEAGADDYFIKPFSPLDLIRKVEDILKE